MSHYSIIAQLKKKKQNDAMAMIYIRGYYNRKPVASISTGKKIYSDHWDPVKRAVVPIAPNALLINTSLSMQLQKMEAELMKRQIMGATINRDHVKKAVQGIDDSKDFFEFCKQEIATYSNEETKRTYTSELTKLEQFKQPVSFADIDYSFLNKYKSYMQKVLENKPNTLWKTFKFINTMIIRAIKTGGIITSNPFNEFNRGKYTQGKRNCLEITHCDEIEKLIIHNDEMISKVSIYFLLMAYSGMRFKDAMKFNPDIHIENNERIIMQYHKAATNVNLKMHDRLKKIVSLVRINRLSISNKHFNATLKIIAIACNIPLKLSSHMGRHTMGGILAEMEIPEEQAKLILGHKDIKSTRIYYHVKDKSIDKAMDKLNTM